MTHISLAVTQAVLNQLYTGKDFQRQIAIKGASPDLADQIQGAMRNNHYLLALNGIFELNVGDTGAIWKKHQSSGKQSDDFQDLFSLLARRPDLPVTFTW